MKTRLSLFSIIAALTLAACGNPRAENPGVWYWPPSWGDQTLYQSLEAGCVGGATSTVIANSTYPCPNAPATTSAPTNPSSPAAKPTAPAFTQQWEVPDGRWTPALTENLVVEKAVQVRPTKPWEGAVGPVPGQVYQFKTEYIDTDATTWQPGVHLYEFDLATGWQPVFVGIQGDSPVQLCWMAEKGAQGAQLLMKTMKGNGTSALVFFTKTNKAPANTCP